MPQLIAAFPNIGIRVLSYPLNTYVKAGGGWTTFDGNVDQITMRINGRSTTYDFEGGAASADCSGPAKGACVGKLK